MLSYNDVIAISLLGTTALPAAFFAYLYQTKRRPYLLVWTGGWLAQLLHFLCMALEARLGSPVWLRILEPLLLTISALAFLYAAQEYAGTQPNRKLFSGFGAIFLVWCAAVAFGVPLIGPQLGISLVFLFAAWTFWKAGLQHEAYTDRFLGLAFLVWAPIPIVGMFFAPAGTSFRLNFAVLADAPQLLVAVLMAAAVFEEDRLNSEENLLALSNLNLLTLSSADAAVEDALHQALERVLDALHLECGAVLLTHPDVRGPSAYVSVGLGEGFCEAAREALIEAHLRALASRLGEFVVLGNLESAVEWESVCNDESFLGVRQFARDYALKTVIATTLNANNNVCGVVFLISKDDRKLSKAEIRVFTAFGRQIGNAVGNIYLMQQSKRRSEELNILNEVGRALSAMLDQDRLFEIIFTQVQRLLDVSSFFIALVDPNENQIRFELEVVDGIRLPKRIHPLEDHLTEVIFHSRQPLLIQEHFQETVQELGAVSTQETGSFCGVPLLAGERVIGVMAVRDVAERRFDAHHLEMMRVLGSEASIAIENARLFRQEQTKARHLALLNNISRHAIATLNPDEMLANIAEQFDQSLSFDHIGIGLLDYATKEVVIRAEAGNRRGALGRRFELEESLIGQVARTGQIAVAHDFSASGCGEPVLDDSVSAIALPILYADQLHGVLYVETAEPTLFSEEDRLLLHTLADLISGALHNALSFQRAQEQAITDGLTGVKTHRFLMEALSAEWKRSTRADRAFCVLLIDLDRFKFVNDFYGHLEGDMVLKRVAHILEEHCRRSDVVARYGGDEFVILMPETTIEQSRQIAQNLRSRICNDSLLREKRITASFGIAGFPTHGATARELIQMADGSMYLSKHQGGNSVCTAEGYDPDEAKKWKRNVLEAYLGVTLKRLFATGPEAFAEICARITQFAESLEPVSPPLNQSEGDAKTQDPLGDTPVTETVISLALAIDGKDHFTQGHSQKVSAYAAMIATELCLDSHEIEEIRIGGLLHDIGKVGIPEHILNKTGPLNPDEWETMKSHARFGDEILTPLRNMERVRQMVRHHHEMFDGSGYPDGLVGSSIPLGARIIAIADAYDTITSDRVYKKARSMNAACAEIERCGGAQFDPDLVQIFLSIVQGLTLETSASKASAAREAAL